MSLNWEIEKIKDFETVCLVEDAKGKKCLSHLTDALIWNCLRVDMGSITAKNVDEYIRRTLLVEHCVGPVLSSGGEEYFITEADIRSHIGLWTNAGEKTKTQFHKALVEAAEIESSRAAARRAKLKELEEQAEHDENKLNKDKVA